MAPLDTDTPPQYLVMSSRISHICLNGFGGEKKKIILSTDRTEELSISILSFSKQNDSSFLTRVFNIIVRSLGNSKTASSLDSRHVTSWSLNLTVASVIVPIRPRSDCQASNKPLILFGVLASSVQPHVCRTKMMFFELVKCWDR